MLRTTPTLFALLLVLGLAAPADARGGALAQHLYEQGSAELRRAELAWFNKDRPTAARHGRAAERYFMDLLVENPDEPGAILLAGQSALFAGELERARLWVDRYAKASRAGENDPDLHYMRAMFHLLGEEHPSRALRSLQRMYSLNPSSRPTARDTLWWIALSELGRAALEGGQTEEAARHFAGGARIARRLGDRGKEMLMLADLGAAYMRSDRYIEAAEIYAGLARLEPDQPLWLWRNGMALANQNRFADAVPLYRRVLAMLAAPKTTRGPQYDELDELPLRLGNCLRHLAAGTSDPEEQDVLLTEAEVHLVAFSGARPRDVRGPKWLGVLYMDQREDPYKALGLFQKAFALDPECEEILRRMIQIHARHPAQEGKDAAAWRSKLEAMQVDLREGAERRKNEIEERRRKTGDTGCA